MNHLRNMLTTGTLMAILLLASQPVHACAVCFGAPGDQNTEAAGHAILFMLGVLVLVLGSIFTTVVVLAWRAHKRSSATHNDEEILG
ncbi:MAG: hypothetical protein LBH01_11825 [Verrucomicrobiales bacterium]|jgi:heme/copper-type cytochrome/quinol oxidase subunit 2|nr:hypothetical protein [Verrucomicrobiales bacterium]